MAKATQPPAEEPLSPEDLVSETPGKAPDKKKTKPDRPWFKRHWKPVAIAAVVFVLAAAGGTLAWQFTHHPKAAAVIKPSPSPTPTPTPSPVTKASPLTGLQVSPDVASSPIVGVVIENHPDARPQSGLGDAGVVYEANAEGGITRFEAFFLDKIPAIMGPVRSVRTYFVDWALEFNAPLAHAGGNADALDLIGPLHMKDMNALSFAADGFYRTTDRYAPHNLYTNTAKLTALMQRLGFWVPSNFTPSPRKADTPSQNPEHPNIHINFSYSGYQVDYKYDPSTNDYARFMAGAPHIDRNTGAQIHVKNVVVEMMPTSYGTTRIGEQTVIMQTVGTGQGWVFRDGQAIPITWSKTSHTDRTKLIGADGKDVPLDAGNTWYAIVPVGKTVSF